MLIVKAEKMCAEGQAREGAAFLQSGDLEEDEQTHASFEAGLGKAEYE